MMGEREEGGGLALSWLSLEMHGLFPRAKSMDHFERVEIVSEARHKGEECLMDARQYLLDSGSDKATEIAMS